MTLEFIKMIKWWLFKKLHFKRKWNSSQRMAVYKDPELTFFHRHTKSILAHRAVPKMPTLMGWQEMKLSLFADGMILVRSPREGNSNPLQYSCLDNPIDRGAWWAIVREVAGSDTAEWPSTHMTQYIKNLRHHQKPMRTNTFSKSTRHKINIQNLAAFLFTNNELSDRNRENYSIYNFTQKNKISGNKFNQGGERPVLWKL